MSCEGGECWLSAVIQGRISEFIELARRLKSRIDVPLVHEFLMLTLPYYKRIADGAETQAIGIASMKPNLNQRYAVTCIQVLQYIPLRVRDITR